jgi:hypothetical protein
VVSVKHTNVSLVPLCNGRQLLPVLMPSLRFMTQNALDEQMVQRFKRFIGRVSDCAQNGERSNIAPWRSSVSIGWGRKITKNQASRSSQHMATLSYQTSCILSLTSLSHGAGNPFCCIDETRTYSYSQLPFVSYTKMTREWVHLDLSLTTSPSITWRESHTCTRNPAVLSVYHDPYVHVHTTVESIKAYVLDF